MSLHGVFPNELKIAKVIPLFKGGESKYLNNYRPVSVLPVFSKVLEKLMYDRIMAFVKENDIIYNMQFGFRKGHSTSMALMLLTDRISKALYNAEYVLGVFLDFSKALIRLIMKFCCVNYIVTVSEVLLTIGWTVTYRVGLNMFHTRMLNHPRKQSRVVCHKVQF